MGRRPNQAQEATLDIGQQDVLLGLVEAMNRIDEKNGLSAARFADGQPLAR